MTDGTHVLNQVYFYQYVAYEVNDTPYSCSDSEVVTLTVGALDGKVEPKGRACDHHILGNTSCVKQDSGYSLGLSCFELP